MKSAQSFAVTIAAGLCLGWSGLALSLEAGFATADITPDVTKYPVPMAGYGAREGKPSTGVHDPLHAKVLFLRDGEQGMALVTCDLRSITPELKGWILEDTADTGLTMDSLFLCASHSHSGPSLYPEPFWQFQFGKYDPDMVREMAKKIATALRAASASCAPVTAGYGERERKDFARNRRWGYDTEARVAAGETPAVDGMLRLIRIDREDHTPAALIVNYTAHPTILGADNFLLSGEWPGALQRRLQEIYPSATVLFVNGALGDQSPAGAEGEDDFAKVLDYGGKLADSAAELTAAIKTGPVRAAIVRATPELPEITFSEGAKNGPYTNLMGQAFDALPQTLELQILQLGDAALVGLPGEPVVEVGAAVAAAVKAAGISHPVVAGLANDYIGYIVNEKEYAHGGYEVDLRSYYGPGLGGFVVQQSGLLAETLNTPAP